MPIIGPRWDPWPATTRPGALAAALGIAPAVARLLCQRGFSDPERAQRFLNPSLEHLHDPMLLADMRVAVDRILAAIARKERIAIHGDYDVDGITSTVILRRALEMLGADVVHFIPERLKDGYGLQPAAIERLHADGVALVISVDCGIRGAEAARRARELGVDLIITDHHEPDAELPPALAVINPKRHDCSYPDKYLAGVGVALKLVQALCRRAGPRELAAGVHQGRRDRHAGRRGAARRREPRHREARARSADARARTRSACARCSTCRGLTGKTIDSYHIGFMVAPRVNAAGRMSTPDIATRLLLAADETMAEEVRAARAAARRRERPAPGGRSGDPRAPRRRSSRPIPRSARARCSSSPAKAGTAASSASSRRSSWTPFTGRRSCCRSRTASRTARAAAFRGSTCSARSSGART